MLRHPKKVADLWFRPKQFGVGYHKIPSRFYDMHSNWTLFPKLNLFVTLDEKIFLYTAASFCMFLIYGHFADYNMHSSVASDLVFVGKIILSTTLSLTSSLPATS